MQHNHNHNPIITIFLSVNDNTLQSHVRTEQKKHNFLATP